MRTRARSLAFTLLIPAGCDPATPPPSPPEDPPAVAPEPAPAVEPDGASAPGCAAGAGVAVTHVSNAGFVLRAGERAVLVDAIHGKSYPGFTVNSPEQRAAIDKGEAPFDGVDVVLATHHHADHFNAAMLAKYVLEHTSVHFVSTDAAVTLVRDVTAGDQVVAENLHGLALTQGTGATETLTLGDISITAVELAHIGGQPMPNAGFVVELGGVRVLHVGDTLVAGDAFPKAAVGRVDVALVPHWYLTEDASAAYLKDVLKPARVVPMHLPAIPEDEAGAAEFAELKRVIMERTAGAEWLYDPNATWTYCPSSS